MAKDTKTIEESPIYQRRVPKTERQKLKEMSFKQKISYFNAYYRNLTIIILICIFFVSYTLYSMFSPKPDNVLNAVIINDPYNSDKKEMLIEDFGAYLGINSKKQSITLDDSYFLNFDDSMSVTSPIQDRISTYCYAKQLDIIIADEEVFEFYAKLGYLDNLEEQLPTDLYSYFSNSFYMSSQEEDSKLAAYGIYLDDSDVYHNLEGVNEHRILGIVSNSRNKDTTLQFLRYLFHLE